MPYKLSKPASLLVALTTMFGLALHDTKVDTMTSLVVAIPAALVAYEGAHLLFGFGESHTHVERVSISETASRHTSLAPWLKARHNEDTRYRLGKNVVKGHHPFDNYSLPVIA